MKRLIFLKMEYLDLEGKKINKAKEQEMRAELYQKSIKQFKKDMKEWIDNKFIKITREFDITKSAVLIQFDDDKWCDLYNKLVSVDIVDIIDVVQPVDEA